MSAHEPSSVESLLAHEGWLRRLARALVGDSQTADDVAQETWARVLARPPREVASTRAWLARVARRVAGERRRDERARAQREQRAARTEARDDSSWSARLEAQAHVQRELTRAVLELSEPARSVIVLRYFEGRSGAEIARDAGVPESTIRNRLRRALAELRGALDRESGGDRARWFAALGLPLRSRSAGCSTSAAPPVALLVMTSTTKTILGLSAALLATVAFLAWEGGAQRTPLPDPARSPATLDRLDEPAAPPARTSAVEPLREEAPEPAYESPSDPAPAEAAHSVPLAPGDVEVVVVRAGPAADGSLDTPVRAGHVWIGLAGVFLPRDFDESPSGARVTPLDVRGTARFAAIPAGPHPVGVALPGSALIQARVIVPAGQGARCVVRLGDAGLRGVVRDYQGAPVEGARLQISGRGRTAERVHCVLWTDVDGAYAARNLPAGSYGVGVDLSGFQDPMGADYAVLLDLEPATVRVHDFGDSRGLPLWTGVVRTAANERADQRTLTGRGGKVHLTRLDEWSYSYRHWEDDGSFAIRLERGIYRVDVSLPGRDERTTVLEELEIGADASREPPGIERDLVLPGATLSGVVAAGEWIALRSEPEARPFVSMRRPPDGRYRFDAVVPGTWWLTAGELAVEVEVRATDIALQVDLR